MSEMNALALHHGTDKSSIGHNYVAIYEPLFTPFRYESINFLEIGIHYCHSLKMWRDWFPNATIHGVDIRQKWVNTYKGEERMVLERVDQGDVQALTEYAKKGPWRVIVDDGSHMCSHQKQTFDVLWDQVEPGGFYVIEDTHTSYWQGDCDETLVQRMLRLVDEVAGTPYDSSGIKEDEGLTKHQREVESIQFRVGLIIIKKRGNHE